MAKPLMQNARGRRNIRAYVKGAAEVDDRSLARVLNPLAAATAATLAGALSRLILRRRTPKQSTGRRRQPRSLCS